MSDFQNRLKTLLPGIMAAPSLYLHSLDMEKGQALLIEADKAFYKNALFLDQRVFSGNLNGAWVPLDVLFGHVEGAKVPRKSPAHFIFHSGHSGSTLVSKLLDEVSSTLNLREPLPLRTLAAGMTGRKEMPDGAFERVFEPVYKLLVRRFTPDETVIIKATSMCNNLGPKLLAQNPANKALLLYVTGEVFLANMLDKRETPDIEGFLPHRLRTLQNLIPDLRIDASGLGRPEKIALSWLAEAAHLAQMAAGECGPRTLVMDFDQFLKQRDIHLEMIFRHFDLPGGGEAIGRALLSPVFKGYAKKPDFPFGPETRSAILKESRAENREAIKKGLKFAVNLAGDHRLLAKALEKIPLEA